MKRKIGINKFIILFALIISGLIIFLSDDRAVYIHVIAFSFPIIVGYFVIKMDVLHPYVWYVTFFAIYSCAYPILYMFNYVVQFGYSKDIMLYQWIALAVSMIILPSDSIKLNKEKILYASRHEGILNIIENLVLLYVVFTGFLIISGGYANKNDIYSSNNFLLTIGFMDAYFAIFLYCYELCRNLIQQSPYYKKIILKFFSIISLFSIITGERDYLFTVLLITLVVLIFFEKIKKRVLIVMIPIGFILLPLSNIFKYYLLSGGVSGSLIWNNLLFEFLDGEFISASRNLQILVSSGYDNYFGGSTLINDFIRIFYNTGYSNQTWFNDNFFAYGHITQYGFSLVGEGFVNGGVIGIIGIFTFVSLLIRILYSRAMKSFYYMVIYFYMIPIFIYSTRADLANILSPLFKYVILGVLIIKISRRIYIKNNRMKS